MDGLCADHRNLISGKIRWRHHRTSSDGTRLERFHGTRGLDEHPRADGTDRTQHRLRPQSHTAGTVRDACDHGTRHHFYYDSDLHFIAPGEEFLAEESHREPAAKLRLLRPIRQGILVPVSNPEEVRPLLEIALWATAAEDLPPRVAACAAAHRRRSIGVKRSSTPYSPAFARSIGCPGLRAGTRSRHCPQASWTEDPAHDIIQLATEVRAAWILLGFQRPVFGADFRDGAVAEILQGSGEPSSQCRHRRKHHRPYD